MSLFGEGQKGGGVKTSFSGVCQAGTEVHLFPTPFLFGVLWTLVERGFCAASQAARSGLWHSGGGHW